jgi:3'-phosphoadenosine 5'-phosphosulfate sulfotransferase (PAPS reductase)/FAD synthetase
MQSLPLTAKIRMTKERIRAWYESWWRYEIYDKATGKTRFVTFDNRDYSAEPPMKETEYIESAYPGAVYVSFSGGKDSTVLKHIVDSIYSDVPSVFVNTGLEYPEIQHFVREVKAGKYDCFNPDVEILRPEMRFDKVIKKYGYPVVSKRVAGYVETAKRNPDSKRARWIRGEEWTKFVTGGKWAFLIDAPFMVSAKCCAVMKHKPINQYGKLTGRKAIIGTMATESPNREQAWLVNGCNAFEAKMPTSQPLSFWTEQDILHYIKQFNVPYCPVYGEIKVDDHPGLADQMNLIDYLGCYEPEDRMKTTGCNRTGCMFCMFGCHLEKEPNRFQRMKITHPEQYAYCMDKLGLKEVLEYIGVPYE